MIDEAALLRPEHEQGEAQQVIVLDLPLEERLAHISTSLEDVYRVYEEQQGKKTVFLSSDSLKDEGSSTDIIGEFTGLPVNREIRRQMMRDPIARESFHLVRKIIIYCVQNDISSEEDVALVCGRFQSTQGFIADMNYAMKDLGPVYRTFFNAERQLEGSLSDELTDNPSLASDIIGFISQPSAVVSPAGRGLMLTLAQNWQNKGEASIAEQAIKLYRETQTARAPYDYIRECLTKPESWGKQNELLKFIGFVANKPNSDELIASVVKEIEHWPNGLASGFRQFNENQAAAVLSVRRILGKISSPWATDLSLEDLDSAWNSFKQKISEAAKPQAGEGGSSKLRKLGKRVLDAKPTAKPDEGAPAKGEIITEPYEQVTIRLALENNTYKITSEDAKDYVDKMIEEYTEAHKGAKNLREDLQAAIAYILDPSSQLGIIRLKDRSRNVEGRVMPIWRLKPSRGVPGVPRHSPLMGQTRIFFLRLDDHKISIIGIEKLGDGKNRTYRKKGNGGRA